MKRREAMLLGHNGTAVRFDTDGWKITASAHNDWIKATRYGNTRVAHESEHTGHDDWIPVGKEHTNEQPA